MKPEDLDDHAPIEPDDGLLATVHARSRSFRRRRTTQRLTSATAGLVVIALVVGIALTRGDSGGDRQITLPAARSTTTTKQPRWPITPSQIIDRWRPIALPPQVNKGPLIVAPPGRPDPYLSFTGRGQWRGSDGCNEIGGTYRLDANGVRFGSDFHSTAVLCAADHPDFLPIELAARSEIRDNQLTFLDSGGREIARFARAGVTARVELPATTIAAGSSMTAQVVVENDTGHQIQTNMCGSFFQVELRRGKVTSAGIWTQCAVPFTIPIGESSYPVSVQASYGLCAADSPGIPPCLPTGPRPLPPGEYQANLLQSSPVVALPLPIEVTITAQ